MRPLCHDRDRAARRNLDTRHAVRGVHTAVGVRHRAAAIMTVVSRRAMVAGAAAGAAALATVSYRSATKSATKDVDKACRELDAKIKSGMQDHAIPGVAVAVLVDGREYIKGYGGTN